MSIIKVNPIDFETISLQTSPVRHYKSGSLGITGSIKVFAVRSRFDKDVQSINSLTGSEFVDDNLPGVLDDLQSASRTALDTNQGSYAAAAQSYMEAVGGRESPLNPGDSEIIVLPSTDGGGGYVEGIPETPRNKLDVDIIRFEPSFSYTNDTGRKSTIINSLYPRNRVAYPTAHYAYTNYHCLNFFTASSIPRSAAIIYPNSSSVADPTIATGSYVVDDGFTFEFYIKPKNFLRNGGDGDYKAGTIVHLSSSYAISLVTGSSVGADDVADKFRIVLQLSHSSDYNPATLPITAASNRVSSATYPHDLTLVSDDNALNKNWWHHVSAKWQNKSNGNRCTIHVDGRNVGEFVIPSSSVGLKPPPAATGNPDALIIGNYFEGSNTGDNRPSRFFTERVHERDGVYQMDWPSADSDGPTGTVLDNPLCAELHEIRIFNKARTEEELRAGRKTGLLRDEPGLIFYLQPFFTKKSPYRKQIGEIGGILVTPFQGISGSTIDPFNISLSFGVGGHYINLENFTRDFAQLNYPRLFDLTASQINVTAAPKDCNAFLYSSGSAIYRNLFMLPCDNGKFQPNFYAISQVTTGSTPKGKITSGSEWYKYRNDLNDLDLSLINLRNLLPSSSFVNYIVDFVGKANPDGDQDEQDDQVVHVGAGFQGNIMGASPEDMGIDMGEVLTIFQRTRDDSSNEVAFFDVSNLFYGQKIKPGSLKMIDRDLSGSFGTLDMVIRDDGYGNLYRADASTEHATWNSVGNVFYHEGIAVIKSPNVPFFGQDEFELELRGEHEVHVMKTDIVSPAGAVNSSSNPNYIVASASTDANQKESQFVAITGINFHDDNLNVIMRSKFAQPVIKKNTDKILFRTKLDF